MAEASGTTLHLGPAPACPPHLAWPRMRPAFTGRRTCPGLIWGRASRNAWKETHKRVDTEEAVSTSQDGFRRLHDAIVDDEWSPK